MLLVSVHGLQAQVRVCRAVYIMSVSRLEMGIGFQYCMNLYLFFLYEITYVFFICTDELLTVYILNVCISYSLLFGYPGTAKVYFNSFMFVANDTKVNISAILYFIGHFLVKTPTVA